MFYMLRRGYLGLHDLVAAGAGADVPALDASLGLERRIRNLEDALDEYVRGVALVSYADLLRGVVDVVHGTMANPIDHRDVYPTLYTVRFVIKELFGGRVEDTLRVDVHEEWLEPA